jgi:5-methylcytosine-specific restriction endonuclease McrA
MEKTCSKCLVSKKLSLFDDKLHGRFGKNARCRSCVLVYTKEWQAKNRVRHLELRRSWYFKNREKLRPKWTTQKKRDSNKQWNARNKARKSELGKEWRANCREKYKAGLLISKQRRRAREANAEGTFSWIEWQLLLTQYERRCLKCEVHESLTPEGYLTHDHVIPLSRGGSNFISNIQPLCMTCNRSKGTKPIDYRLSVVRFMHT